MLDVPRRGEDDGDSGWFKADMNAPAPELSVILPVCNEADNLRPLHEALLPVLESLGQSYEIIYADDGSTDGSTELLRELVAGNPRVKAIFLKRNFGQTAALAAGIDHSRGEVIVLLDADGQNDPQDIPRLLTKLKEGYDIASGWRKARKDPLLTKRLPSHIANWIISRVTGVRLHDSGCTLKAYRRKILEGVSLYGEMHRFIPIYGHWMGAKVAEVIVTHHPRRGGKSKYSLTRTFKVLLDLPLLILMGSYLTRPIHFFGMIGLILGGISFITGILLILKKISDPEEKIHRNPLLIISIFFALAAIQLIMIGLLAELMTRVYHEGQDKKIYVVSETLNLASPASETGRNHEPNVQRPESQ